MDTPWMPPAWAELGVKETPGPSATPRVLEYLRIANIATSDDAVPWCSGFANWTMAQAQIQGTKSAAARSWLAWGVPIDSPVYGAVAVFSRGSSTWQGHVTFVVDRLPDGLLLCLGGNQGDCVSVARYPTSRLLGLRMWTGIHVD